MADGTYRALLIGNSSFPADPHNLQELAGPVNDVAALRAVLSDDGVGLFGAEDVRLLAERTVGEVRVELERFFSNSRRDDTLLLYYSGHGVLDQRNQLFLCARDTRTDLLKSTAVGASEISLMFEESAARTTVIVLDCCHSGAFKGGRLADSLRGSGRYLLTSARGRELAADADSENTTSIFTHHLVEGLRAGARDSDGDGFTDLGDLYDYVQVQLDLAGKQVPQRSFSGGGVVRIARRAAPAGSDVSPVVGGEPKGKPILSLSTTHVDLGTLPLGETPPAEQIFVVNDADVGQLDWVATTSEDWIEIEPHADFFKLSFQPHPGVNQGRVVVHDRTEGARKIVRVTVRMDEGARRASEPAQPPPVPPPAEEAAIDSLDLLADPRPARPGGYTLTRRSWAARAPRWALPALGAAVAAVVLVAVLLVAAGGDGGGDGGGDRAGVGDVERTFLVPGNRAFTATGVEIRAGDIIRVDASGTVLHDAGSNRGAGPDGDPAVGVLRSNVVAEQDHGGLIGRIGADGDPFPVGSRWELSGGLTGELFFGINDSGVANNGGQFVVNVAVERA